jgi:hypothetical protein
MFDKTIQLVSSDGNVALSVTAGTEGVKSLILSMGKNWHPVTEQQLMDICAPAIQAWFEAQDAPPSPVAPPSGSSGPVC